MTRRKHTTSGSSEFSFRIPTKREKSLLDEKSSLSNLQASPVEDLRALPVEDYGSPSILQAGPVEGYCSPSKMELKAVLARLELEKKSLSDRLNRADDTNLRRVHEYKTQETARLRQENTELKQENTLLLSDLNIERMRREAAEADRDRLRQRLRSVESQLTSVTSQLISTIQEKEDMFSALSDKSDSLDCLQFDYQMLMDYIDDMDESMNEMEKDVRKEQESQENKRNTLEKKIAKSEKDRRILNTVDLTREYGHERRGGKVSFRLCFSSLCYSTRNARLEKMHTLITKLVGPLEDPDQLTAEIGHLIDAYMKKFKIPVGQLQRLSLLDDLQLSMHAHLTQHQRQELKSFVYQRSIDIFAVTNKVHSLRKSIYSKYRYQYTPARSLTVNGISKQGAVLELMNIKEALTFRLNNLFQSGQLKYNSNTPVSICYVGDKGKSTTKVGILIGDVNKSNDVSNMLLIARYDGEDTAEMMRGMIDNVHKQLNEMKSLKCMIEKEQKEVSLMKWLTGDFNYIYSVLGMTGACSIMNCPFCWLNERAYMRDPEQFRAPRIIADLVNIVRHRDPEAVIKNETESLTNAYKENI